MYIRNRPNDECNQISWSRDRVDKDERSREIATEGDSEVDQLISPGVESKLTQHCGQPLEVSTRAGQKICRKEKMQWIEV